MLVCDVCGAEFRRPSRRGRIPLRCSTECKRAVQRSYPREPGSSRIAVAFIRRERECEICGVRWCNAAGQGPRKFCSPTCRDAAAKGLKNPKESYPCAGGCGATLPPTAFNLYPKGGRPQLCGTCEPRHPKPPHMRLRKKVWVRDGWICQICGGATDQADRSWGAFGPNTPTVDHIVPKSLGGVDELHNLRTAHAMCNTMRGTARGEQLGWAV